MKARELGYLLGLRPKPKTYGYALRVFDLPADGRVEYAQWQHPNESAKAINQETIHELRTFLKPGDVAIDIGAHSGDTAIPMALAVGRAGWVLALEPNRLVFPILEKNAQLNPDRTRILPLMFAATPEDGRFEFEYSDSGFCNGGRHEGISRWRHGHAFRLEVEGRNLERWLADCHPELLPKIAFIKVDAEGYDLAILKSLVAVIDRQRPFVKAEMYRHASLATRTELFQLFASRNYTVHFVESESCYRGEILQKADLMRWPHFDVFCAPRERGQL